MYLRYSERPSLTPAQKNSLNHVGFEVLTAVVTKSSLFWDITPCSPLKDNRRFGGTCLLHLQGWRISQARNHVCLPPAFTLVSCLAYSSTLKIEETWSSETSVDFQRTTWRYIREDGTLQVKSQFHNILIFRFSDIRWENTVINWTVTNV
jgi:hypothetical protein